MQKKITLVKQEGRYVLYGEDGAKIASSTPNPFKKLSTSNCDEIFGIVDVDKFVKEHVDVDPNLEIGTSEYHNAQVDFKAGFNKKAELDKDKLFTVEDMKKGMSFAKDFINWEIKDEEMIAKYGFSCSKLNPNNSEDAFIQSLQQPTEIEVEIVTHVDLAATPVDSRHPDACLGTDTGIPYLDKDGCLILRKL